MNSLLTAIRVSVLLLLICGIAYPLAVTGVAQLLFPARSGGQPRPYRLRRAGV